MRLRTWVENTATRFIGCPYDGAQYPDLIMRMNEYYGDYCTYCGQLNKHNDDTYYLVECTNMMAGQNSIFRIIEGATADDGYNLHVCIQIPSGI